VASDSKEKRLLYTACKARGGLPLAPSEQDLTAVPSFKHYYLTGPWDSRGLWPVLNGFKLVHKHNQSLYLTSLT